MGVAAEVSWISHNLHNQNYQQGWIDTANEKIFAFAIGENRLQFYTRIVVH